MSFTHRRSNIGVDWLGGIEIAPKITGFAALDSKRLINQEATWAIISGAKLSRFLLLGGSRARATFPSCREPHTSLPVSADGSSTSCACELILPVGRSTTPCPALALSSASSTARLHRFEVVRLPTPSAARTDSVLLVRQHFCL